MSFWSKTTDVTQSIDMINKKVDQRLKVIEGIESRVNMNIEKRFKLADKMVLNTFFNQQIIDLKATVTHLDGLAGMTDNPDTRKRIANTKVAVQQLIDGLLAEYTESVSR